MIKVKRFIGNPILKPGKESWDAKAAFNPSPAEYKEKTFLLYRAEADGQKINDQTITLSTIGICESRDKINFDNRRQFIKNEFDFEKYGCEDPRVTKIGDEYFIFYTALSKYPFEASGIKVAVAISKDLKKIKERHLVTPFNAKAMTLFPERINGKITVIVSVNTDLPPTKIAIAQVDKMVELWSQKFWDIWYKELDQHVLELKRNH